MKHQEERDIGLSVLLTLVAIVGLAIGALALMAFAPVVLFLASAYVAWRERKRAYALAAAWPIYRWLGHFWQLALWSILVISAVLMVAAWFEYSLIINEIWVALSTAYHKYTLPYLLLFGGVYAVVVAMVLERTILSALGAISSGA